MSIKTAKIFTI